MDVHEADALGGLKITDEGLIRREALVLDTCVVGGVGWRLFVEIFHPNRLFSSPQIYAQLSMVYNWERVTYAEGMGIPVAAYVGGGYDKDLQALARRHCILHHVAREIFESNKL